MSIPILETERLRLRGHRPSDFNDCVAMWADPNVTRFIGGKPSTAQQTWLRMLGYIGHWSLMGFGYWAIEEKMNNRYVGELGFADFKRDLAAIDGLPELGWALASHAHGKGYATEAIQAALQWGDAHLKAEKTACIIHPDNLASLRVAQKTGYRELQRSHYRDEPTILFTRTNLTKSRPTLDRDHRNS